MTTEVNQNTLNFCNQLFLNLDFNYFLSGFLLLLQKILAEDASYFICLFDALTKCSFLALLQISIDEINQTFLALSLKFFMYIKQTIFKADQKPFFRFPKEAFIYSLIYAKYTEQPNDKLWNKKKPLQYYVSGILQ